MVDNHSSDNTPDYIRGNFPWVDVTTLENNLGYGGAINRVAPSCRGDYILILNPDVVVQNGTLRTLVEFLDLRPQAAACGPKLLSPEGRFRFESRRGFPTPLNSFAYISGLDRLFPFSRRLSGYQRRWLSPDFEVATDSLSGSCMMVRRNCFQEVGGFDESYFLFGEDIDLCWKLRHAGYENWYVPTAVVVHIKGASMKFAPGVARKEFYRSMLIYMDKRLAPFHSKPVMWAARSGVKIVAKFTGKYRSSNYDRMYHSESHLSHMQVTDGQSIR